MLSESPVALARDPDAHRAELQVREDIGGRHIDIDFDATNGCRAAHRRAHQVRSTKTFHSSAGDYTDAGVTDRLQRRQGLATHRQIASRTTSCC